MELARVGGFLPGREVGRKVLGPSELRDGTHTYLRAINEVSKFLL